MPRPLPPTETTVAATTWRNWLCFAFIASLALSVYKVYRPSTINNDGLLYLSTAQTFIEQGFKAAFAQFNWPAFPMLIGLTHQAFGISYEHAAYGINALLLALLSVGFMLLYREVTAGQGRPWVAAAVILASPQLTDYRSFIVRDIGYWALGLWAVLCFTRYCRRHRWSDALAWQACIAAAIAFRIEGAALAALLPIYCLLQGERRGTAWLKANSLFLLGAAILAALLATGAMPAPTNARLEQLQHFLSLPRISAEFAAKAEVIARHAQTFYAPQDIGPLLAGGVFSLLLYKIASCLGLAYASLLLWALWRERVQLFRQPAVIWYAAAITAIPLLAFAVSDLFISGRYMGLLVVLLSLPAAQSAEFLLFGNGPVLLRPRWAAVLALVLAVMLLDAFIKTGPTKRYLRKAGDWARDHLPATISLCSDDPSVPYYAGHGRPAGGCSALESLERNEAGQYGAFMVKIGRKDQEKRDRLQALLDRRGDWAIAAKFSNQVGDAVYIVMPAPPRP
ncbi:hypothetical protein [Methylogaea oryzae]|uniref:hypothetical protein n=1 Tax=Methylogaea oryzae TaxID=1295382 RepID=UPI001C8270C6|nr:hypothetical protein [Methylogaea oryzae]